VSPGTPRAVHGRNGLPGIDSYRYIGNYRYMDKAQALEALSALAHATRLDVFRLLVQSGPEGMPAGEIASRLGVVQNTLSTHLGALARAGLIRRDREGRVIRCRADYAGMQALLAYLLEDCCRGDQAICEPLFDVIKCAC